MWTPSCGHGLVLVPWFYQGMHCFRGSASFLIKNEARTFVGTAGGACNSVGSKAEPWNQLADWIF